MEHVTREAAKNLGLKRYFTGLPCRNGHVAERWTLGGHCVDCQRADQAKVPPDVRRQRQRVYDRTYKAKDPARKTRHSIDFSNDAR